MSKKLESLKNFAKTLHDTLVSDRDINIGVGGMTGEGKSVFMTQLIKEYCIISNQKFSFNCMTWEREELLEWIDGEKEGEKQKYGGQIPQFSPIIADELISMFYKRNWYEDEQKESVELFNKCRDRHLLIIGGIPSFWDLDGGMLNRIRFYIYIPYRGVAWVFQQENNPFSVDKWNARENMKIFRKKKVPYYCPNFLCELKYDDLDPQTKQEYYNIRNTKRKNTEGQNKKVKPERKIKAITQRNTLLLELWNTGKYSKKKLGRMIYMNDSQICDVINGVAGAVYDTYTRTDGDKSPSLSPSNTPPAQAPEVPE